MNRVILLSGLLALAACAQEPVSIPVVPDAGYTGGEASDFATTDADQTAVGVLGGSNAQDRVYFEENLSTLNPAALSVLDAQIVWLNDNTSTPVRIEGHADERGTRDYNLQLGSARASAVRNYMVSRGVSDSRISIITYGRERPVATCAEESCYSQNRRAVTVIATGAVGS